MYNKLINNIRPLGFTWETSDPFLFCVHHQDDYPAGNEEFGPAASLRDRALGQDFSASNPWRMYHGERIPGFPAHPHRGFETVTVVLKGFVDHSDSHGAAGRYGQGDVQWMTAGAGLQHCEMFPLLNRDSGNPLELFQIWLNLPAERKFADPHFAMLWAEDIPVLTSSDKNGKSTSVNLIAGTMGQVSPPPPAPDSWAAEPANEVGIWLITMEAGASYTLPKASPGVKRSLYFYEGNKLLLAGIGIEPRHSVELLADQEVTVGNGDSRGSMLVLQGQPIREPVAQYGPFVMNTQAEVQQAIDDYRKTQFGGWPWPRPDHVHKAGQGRFARYADGRESRHS